MDIVLIGSGNVATHLGLALFKAHHQIKQVYSRSACNAKILADKLSAQAISNLTDIDEEAELYILSIKDDALESLVLSLPLLKGCVVHTAGSISIHVLSRFNQYGVFYPFQTFTKESETEFRSIPILVESNTEELSNRLYILGRKLSDTVIIADSYRRGQLHIAAVYACNFVNHMYRLAHEVMQENNLPFDLLHPLIAETSSKALRMTPSQAQTGPAARKDQKIIRKHLTALGNNNELQEIYKLLSESIIARLHP